MMSLIYWTSNDILWNVQMIYIPSDYFVIEIRRINIFLTQDYENVLLFIVYEHGLFLK